MPGSIQSLKKAANILNLFTQESKLFGITDIAKKLALPKPTVQSLVRTLEEIGYLEKDFVTSKYMLGPALFQLGMRFIANMDLAVIARDWMDRLCRQFDEAIHVGMMVGLKVVIVLRADPASRYMIFPQAGTVIPVHTSGVGKILLAFMEQERRDEVLAGCAYPKLTEKSIDNRTDFLAELDRVRVDGVAFDREESLTGLSCVSGPVFNNKGQCMAAFSVSGNAHTIDTKREEIISAVRYVSSQISAQLGFHKG